LEAKSLRGTIPATFAGNAAPPGSAPATAPLARFPANCQSRNILRPACSTGFLRRLPLILQAMPTLLSIRHRTRTHPSFSTNACSSCSKTVQPIGSHRPGSKRLYPWRLYPLGRSSESIFSCKRSCGPLHKVQAKPEPFSTVAHSPIVARMQCSDSLRPSHNNLSSLPPLTSQVVSCSGSIFSCD
jgi:hypothetical protein